MRERGERRPPRMRREGESLCERRPPKTVESLRERRLPSVRAAKIASTAGTGPRDPRSVDRRKSARVAERRARVAERAKDVAREKAEVERVSLEWLAGELAGGRDECVARVVSGEAEESVCCWRGACVPRGVGCGKKSRP